VVSVLLIAGALSVWTMTAQSRAKDGQGSMPLVSSGIPSANKAALPKS
jgi:hypothetical protein